MTDRREVVVTPSVEMSATVRHAEPPETVPDELVPYVVASHVDGRLDDWRLTDDVVAFGDVDTPMSYQRWRGTWERSWPLDPRSSLRQLSAIARTMAAELALSSEPLLDLPPADGAEARTIDGAEELLRLATELERLRDAIRSRDTTGYGIVDVTEGHSRVGLARAWSPATGEELLAADPAAEVWMRPGSGLHVELAGPPPCSLGPVEEVALQPSGVEVRAAGDVVVVPIAEATALSWVVPGAAQWRVRVVPEVLVWARTFGGLPEACRYAAALRHPLTVRENVGPAPG